MGPCKAEGTSLGPLEAFVVEAQAPEFHILLGIVSPPIDSRCFFLLSQECLSALSLCVALFVLGTAQPPRRLCPIIGHAWHFWIKVELGHVRRFTEPVEVGSVIAITVEAFDIAVELILEE